MKLTSGLLVMMLVMPGLAGRTSIQTRVVTGRVTDSLTGAPVTTGQVSVKGSTTGTTVQSDGAFTIEVPDGSVVLEVRSIGFMRREITVLAGQNTVLIPLERAYLQLEAIEVTGQASRVERRSVGNATSSVTASGPPIQLRGVSPIPGRNNPNFHTEEYGRIVENAFKSPTTSPLSTFSIDVDRASYANVRRFITGGSRPPIDAVRVEEMINYFPYDYPEPSGEHPFSVTMEVAAAPWSPTHRLLRIGIKGRSVNLENLPPNNLVFLIDVSGSMNAPNKLPLLKSAFRLLVNELRPEDQVAMVVYAGAAGMVLGPTPGTRKTDILAAITALEAGGSTAGGAGLRLAYQVAHANHLAGGNNRVILATDGDFNVGMSSDGELIRYIEEQREQGTFLTVLGFGIGNLKDSKIEQLADHGNGNYAYIDNLLEARKVLVTEMGGTLLTIAKDVKIQVEFNPARVQGYRLIGYENRLLNAEDFTDDKKDAGELGAGHTVTALYEIIPVGVATTAIRRTDSLRYQLAGESPDRSASPDLAFVKLRYKEPDATTSRLLQEGVRDRGRRPSSDMAFASAVAGFGMLLRDSENRGTWTLQDVLGAAEESVGKDPGGYRTEFMQLVQKVMQGEMLATKGR